MVYKIRQIITPLSEESCKCWWGKNIANKFLQELTYDVIITDEIILGNLQYILNLENKKIIVLKNPRPSVKLCENLAESLTQSFGKGAKILAIGSGSVNDIAKYTSYKCGGSYSIIASALSMNGYTSSNASLIKNSIKQSFGAHLPQNVIFDENILSQAPLHLTLAGFYDCLSIITANFDWLLSHIVLKTSYKPQYYRLIKPLLRQLIKSKLEGRKINLYTLTKCVVLGGFAMHKFKTSAPASGFEHILAHCYEKQGKDKIFAALPHGLQIEHFLQYCHQKQINFLQQLQSGLAIKNYRLDEVQIIKNYAFSLKQARQISRAKFVKYHKFTKQDCKKLQLIFKRLNLSFLRPHKICQIFASIAPLSRDRFTIGDVANTSQSLL